jgi:hypothetical protein
MKRETVNDTNTDAGEVRLDEVSSQVSMTEARPAAHSEEYPLLSAIRYYSPEEVYGDDQPAKRTRNSFSSASTHPRTGEEWRLSGPCNLLYDDEVNEQTMEQLGTWINWIVLQNAVDELPQMHFLFINLQRTT